MSLSTCPLTASRSATADCSTLRGRGQKSRGHRSLSSCVEQPADECMQIGEGDVQRPVMSVYIAQSGTAVLVRVETLEDDDCCLKSDSLSDWEPV